MSKFKLSRRTMLRGAVGGSTVAVGLPLLEAMLNDHGTALADGSALPIRFMTFHWADGIVLGQWEPPTTGAGYQLSTQLAPMAPIQQYLTVCTGLQNRCAQTMTHHEGMTAFNGYTYQQLPGLSSNSTGPTIDQVIADTPGVADRTPIHSVHVRVAKAASTDGDGGTTYSALSHRQVGNGLVANTPLTNPQDVWDYLFGEFVPKPDDRDLRTSILDFVKEDVDRLRPKLGVDDNGRMDAHLQGVFELEAKIAATPPTCALPDLPTETGEGNPEPNIATNLAMAQLIAYAFACDVTRVATFQFKRFVSNTSFQDNAPPISGVHHNNSHAGPTNQAYRDGIVYQMARFADAMEVFMNTTEADGSNLLDSSIVYASSDCSTGASHSIARQPILLCGTGRGHLVTPGIHYQATPWNGSDSNPNATGNMSDVLLSCLLAFDPGATSVGGGAPQSNTPLTEILA